MELKTVVGTISESKYIEMKQKVDFHTFEDKEYREFFNQLKQGGFIHGSFDDNHWSMPYKINDANIVISFDIEIYNKLNVALKLYTVLRLISGKSPMTVYNEIVILKKVIFESTGFTDIKKFEALVQDQSNFKNQGYRLAQDTKRFLSFFSINNNEEYIEICNKIPIYKSGNRQLPNFEDVLTFDDIVNDYFRTYPYDQTIEFLPIMMWWILSNILPLRPTEFLLLEKDCLETALKQGNISHFIKVPRIKNESNSPDYILRYDSIEIDQSTYELLVNSRTKIQSLITGDSPYLFPVEYLMHFRSNPRKKKNSRINRRDFDYLKKDFYEKVVQGIYGEYGLDRIKSGDTRHFSIINMCLQGFNMLSIARMAGHDEIDSQYSYYSHAEQFSQSYVYRLAQKKLEQQISNNMSDGLVGWKRYIYDKGKTCTTSELNNEDIVGRIEYGICTEQKNIFPENCIEDCRFCNKYVFHPTVNEYEEGINWLTDCSKDLEKKITESIEHMRDLSEAMHKTIKPSSDELLKTTSRNLVAYMDFKATIDAQLMEVKAVEKRK
jgi:hypothetical protein